MNQNIWDHLNESQKIDLIVKLAAPWYIQFWVSCHHAFKEHDINHTIITYSDLIQDFSGCVNNIFTMAKINHLSLNSHSLENLKNTVPSRKNIGVEGRGSALSKRHIEDIQKMASFYPHIDFSPIGI